MAAQLDEQGVAQAALRQERRGGVIINLTVDELNAVLRGIGLALNMVQNSAARAQLLALQSKLMEKLDVAIG